ncbi:MAG TPA: hypothetical protein VL307_17580 [Chitinophagaceae bacterium]|nr:hypothetical protein [Chitinophagaceae bacterium]
MEGSLLPTGQWTMARRTWLLFTIVYFFLLVMDFTSSDELFPHFVYILLKPYTMFWNWLVPWTGQHILHLPAPITIKPNGSGDTTYNYTLQFLWLVIAFIVAVTWAILDRRRNSYTQLYYWARIILRYYLAFILFVYGSVKVIKLQFPFPDLMRLTEPYGDSSPMGLAWTFIGYSKGYNLFTGGAEMLAGCFLFFKRTTLLGALLAITIMANIAAINFAYDVPVKIFSVNLLLLAGWIAWYDIHRLLNLLVLNKPAPAAQLAMPLKTPWKKRVQFTVKLIVILLTIYATLGQAIKGSNEYGDNSPKPALYGIYDARVFVRNNDTVPPLTTDSLRWKRMIINYKGNVRISTMRDSTVWMALAIDTVKKTIRFTDFNDSTKIFAFRYSLPDKNHLQLTGSMNKDSILMNMEKYDVQRFRLVNRGFHWVNEYPYNR